MNVLWRYVACAATLLCANALATEGSVTLDDATVLGTTEGGVTRYLGIPFAQPPVGKLRLQLPQPIPRYTGTVNATAFGYQCIQQTLVPPALPSGLPAAVGEFFVSAATIPSVPQSEDCLTVNVVVPSGTKPGAKLPVVAWIFGGAYQFGSNAAAPGAVIVNRSIELGQPIIHVSMNYRCRYFPAFGFLGGREVQEAGIGNLGLQDQREALRWVQKYVAAFGGDPEKVTLWGESSGSQSVAYQMVANGGDSEGLFRAGWMDSGTVKSASSVTTLQPTFDSIASEVGCTPGSAGVLDCLRGVSTEALSAAMDKTPTIFTYGGLSLPWLPHVDGVFLRDDPTRLVREGQVADVPFVIGDCEDEGTMFSFASLNVTTDGELANYLRDHFFPKAPDSAMARLLELYPANPAAGSPFGTGNAYNFTHEYKRIAAVQGDFFFQSMRRFFLQQRAHEQRAWSFLYARDPIEGMGVVHTADIAAIYGGDDLTDFLIRFVNTLDPNLPGAKVHWPTYSPESPQMLALVDGETPLKLIEDTFRTEAMEYVSTLSIKFPQ
ncbi:carotenoid ester lipase precursor [Cubamyces menziesii]|nr:carotenoid ester lipase precursor [Cubamyces menziesii]